MAKSIPDPKGKSPRQRRNGYIHKYARTLAGQLHISAIEAAFWNCQSAVDVVKVLMLYGKSITAFYILKIVGNMVSLSDSKLGELAACGVGVDPSNDPNSWGDMPGGITLAEVIKLDLAPFDPTHAGRHNLVKLASYAIVAAMADNFWSDLQKRRNIGLSRHSFD